MISRIRCFLWQCIADILLQLGCSDSALIVKLHPRFSRDYTGSLEVLLVLTDQLCQLSSLSHPFRTCFHVFDVQLGRLCTISPSHDTQQQSNVKNGVSESKNDSLFIFWPETHYENRLRHPVNPCRVRVIDCPQAWAHRTS